MGGQLHPLIPMPLNLRSPSVQKLSSDCEATTPSPCLWLGVLFVTRVKRGPTFERVSASVGLCSRETGFCWAETAASKRPVTFNRSSTETKSPHENPPIRRYSRGIGKSLFVSDCVVANAATVKPVSATKFPANRENNREFCRFRSESAILVASQLANSIL